jgi:hypothetical protein
MTLALTAIGAVASQAAVLTALLYYVGWARTHATWEEFGLDPGLIGYGTEDYVLRSINATFSPLIAVTLVGLGLVVFHRAEVEPRVKRGGALVGRLITGALIIGGLLAAVVFVRLMAPSAVPVPNGIMLPATLLASIAMLAYFGYLHSLRTGRQHLDGTYDKIRAVAFLGLALLGVLWALATYADGVGVRRAETIRLGLKSDPAATVYSGSPLAIAGPGVQVKRIGVDGDRYRYAYTGLRIFEAGNGKIILLPRGWTKGENAFVLRDDESIRMDISVR